MTDDEQIREIYAQFGLAVYFAQVLEHGLVNALVVLDLIPNRRKELSSRKEWEDALETFMGHHFETTMGRMIRSLHAAATVPPQLEDTLRAALNKRNWLAHHFFREYSIKFMSRGGRDEMLTILEECRTLFESADRALDDVVRPLREKMGLTQEILAREEERIMREGHV